MLLSSMMLGVGWAWLGDSSPVAVTGVIWGLWHIQDGARTRLAVGAVSGPVPAADLGSACARSMRRGSWLLRESVPSAQRGRKQNQPVSLRSGLEVPECHFAVFYWPKPSHGQPRCKAMGNSSASYNARSEMYEWGGEELLGPPLDTSCHLITLRIKWKIFALAY